MNISLIFATCMFVFADVTFSTGIDDIIISLQEIAQHEAFSATKRSKRSDSKPLSKGKPARPPLLQNYEPRERGEYLPSNLRRKERLYQQAPVKKTLPSWGKIMNLKTFVLTILCAFYFCSHFLTQICY